MDHNLAQPLADAVRLFGDVVAEIDQDGLVLALDAGWTQLQGTRPAAVLGHPLAEAFAPIDRVAVGEALRAASAGSPSSVDARLLVAGGGERWVELRAVPLAQSCCLGLMRDVSERHDSLDDLVRRQADETSGRLLAEETLAHQANHDSLTGLPNRSCVYFTLDGLLSPSPAGCVVGLILIDVDRFKLVNDSLGRVAGDQLLLQLAFRLRRSVKPADLVARVGADEFAIICVVEDTHTLLAQAHRILDALRAPLVLEGRTLNVSASVGIAVAEAGSDAQTMVRSADAALHDAKESGGAAVRLFDDGLLARAQARFDGELELQDALARSEFRVHLQPKVTLTAAEGDRRVVGYEALVRWERADGALVFPDQFIPLAEETGLIVPIGAWMLRASCAEAATWRAPAGRTEPAPFLAVNLSPRQLTDPLLPSLVAAVLNETGLEPRRLLLEITEATLINDIEATLSTLRALRELGVRLVIDDFGTGYSSLAYLKRLPVQILKIDRSFVSGLGEDPGDLAIVTAIVQMAHALGLEVVAEGVENATQATLLRAVGCDLAQGFYFGRPKPAELTRVGDALVLVPPDRSVNGEHADAEATR